MTEASSSGMDMNVGGDLDGMIGERYRITGIIGEGGMGLVYEAWDTQVGRKVAIKVVRSDTTDSKYLSRFRRELEITSKLRHPSTIRVFEHGETRDRRPYMVMELLTGKSLAKRLEQGPLPELEALQIAQQVAESLSEAHEHGVFHRDLKPDNIFIETVGVTKVVKVLDFGIASGAEATRLTQAGEVFGTPQYMSPEQCNGQRLDHRTDIYSLACILFEMLEGRPPFSSETPMATMLKHVRAKVPPLTKAHAATERVVTMGLRKDRNKRIQSAGRFSELLSEAISAVKQPSSPTPKLPPPPPVRPTRVDPGPLPSAHAERRGKMLAIAGGVAALSIVGFVVFGDWSVPPTVAAAQRAPAERAREGAPASLHRALVNNEVPAVTVLLDGRVQCETPCWVEVPVGDGIRHELRLRKAGFVDLAVPWQPRSASEPLPPLPALVPRDVAELAEAAAVPATAERSGAAPESEEAVAASTD